MAFDLLMIPDVIAALESYIDKKRPPEEMRSKLDLGYRIENQSIVIHEIRPRLDNPNIKIEPEIAKATFIKSNLSWHIFWKRADLKWHRYKTVPIVKDINQVLRIIEEDNYGCFWG